MVDYATKMYDNIEIAERLHEDVQEWFFSRYQNFTPPQRFSIPIISNRKNLLISSPTGSGKTLTAFLSIINNLFVLARENKLKNQTYCIYVSPLKALGRDIEKNLIVPMDGIYAVAEKNLNSKNGPEGSTGTDCKPVKDVTIPRIRIAVRTGDTSSSEKQKMTRKPPHILITTPETLSIVLSTKQFVKNLNNTRYLIVDEIHDLASSKRGTQLSLSMERLQRIVGKGLVRIGLSATQSPIEDIAHFLVGRENGVSRDVTIVNHRGRKKYDMKVIPAFEYLGQPYDVRLNRAVDIMASLIEKYGHTIIFTNTRQMSEKITMKLKEIGVEDIATHHGSLEKEIRFDIEDRLKKGELKAVSTSTSLELGIDVGHIDLVIQLGSPKSVARGVQRIGRAGHAMGKVVRGRFIALELDDILECGVIARNISNGKLDDISIPYNCTDVLAQAIVGMSLEEQMSEDEIFRIAKGSEIFKDMDRDSFDDILDFLSNEQYSKYQIYPRLEWDRENKQIIGKNSARLIYFLNSGTIPPQTEYKVRRIEDDMFIGRLSGNFVESLSKNDVFLLGSNSYRFIKTVSSVVYVKNAGGMVPTVPTWSGGFISRSSDLSLDVGRFLSTLEATFSEKDLLKKGKPRLPHQERAFLNGANIDEKFGKDNIERLEKQYFLTRDAIALFLEYLKKQLEKTAMVPSERKILVEGYLDNMRRNNIIIHSLFGRKNNEAIGRALVSAIVSRFGGRVKYSIHDNGMVLTLEGVRSFRLDRLFNLVHTQNIESILKSELSNSELFKRRFLHCANRSLTILKNYKGHKISIKKQQHQVLDILREVPPELLQKSPPYRETHNEVLNHYLNMEQVKGILSRIAQGKIAVYVRDYSPDPSIMSYSLVVPSQREVSHLSSMSMVFKQLGPLFGKIIGYSPVETSGGKTTQFSREIIDEHFHRNMDFYRRLNKFTGDIKNDFQEIEARIKTGNIKDITGPLSRVDIVAENLLVLLENFGPFTQRELEAHLDFALGTVNLSWILSELEDETDIIKAPIIEDDSNEYYVLRKDLRSLTLYKAGKTILMADVLHRFIYKKFFVKKQELFESIEEGLVSGQPLDIYQSAKRFTANKWQKAITNGSVVEVRHKRFKPRYLPASVASRFAWALRRDPLRSVEQAILKHIIDNPGIKRYEIYKSLEINKNRIYEVLYYLERNYWIARSLVISANGRSAVGFVYIPCETFDDVFLNTKEETLQINEEPLKSQIVEYVTQSIEDMAYNTIRIFGPISQSSMFEQMGLSQNEFEKLVDSLIASGKVANIFIENPYPTEMLISREDLVAIEKAKGEKKSLKNFSQIISETHPYFHLVRHRAFLKFSGVWTHLLVENGNPIAALRLEIAKDEVRAINVEIPIKSQEMRFISLNEDLSYTPEKNELNEKVVSLLVEQMEELLQYYGCFNVDIINIIKINGVLVEHLVKRESWLIEAFQNSGASLIDEKLVVGNLIGVSYPREKILRYVFYKQHVHSDSILEDIGDYIDELHTISSDEELQLRCETKGKNFEALVKMGDMIKAKLIPPRIMYTSRSKALLFKAARKARISPTAKYLLGVMPDVFIVNSNKWNARSTLSTSVFREAKKELMEGLYVAKDSKNSYVKIEGTQKISRKKARRQCIKNLFSSFGVFTLNGIKKYVKDEFSLEELRSIINSLVAEGYLIKGYLLENSTELYYLVKDDLELLEEIEMYQKVILSPKDILWYYLKTDITNKFGKGDWYVLFKGGTMEAAFRGDISGGIFYVEEYAGNDLYRFTAEKWLWKQGYDVKGLKEKN